MTVVSAITGLLTALKSAKDILESAVAVRDAKVLDAKIGEVNKRLVQAQVSAIAINDERTTLIETIANFKEEVAELKRWGEDKQRYQLQAVASGAFAYCLKPGHEAGEPKHWLCTTCYQNNKKSLLQAAGPAALSGNERNNVLWRCQ